MTTRAATARQETALEGVLPSSACPQSGEHATYDREQSQFDELAFGTTIAGKYRVRGVLGRGGFATVYDAEHLDLRRQVALKVLHRTGDTPAVLIERFAREVRISALVRHPHVLEVFDAGVVDDGSPFLVMEKIEGTTLHDHLTAVQRLSIDETLQVSRQLLSALVALAERGIVHRDIKPENLMLTRDESGALHLKLVDFGIALVRNERIERRLTMQGALIGTPHYMAPEQLRSEVVDARVDLYATGVVMYQALTGSMPYDGPDLASLTLNVLNGQARSLREVRRDCPNALVRIVERALSRSPERRYQDAATMLADVIDCGTPSGLRSIAQLPRLGATLGASLSASLTSSSAPTANKRSRRIKQASIALTLALGSFAWSHYLGDYLDDKPLAAERAPTRIGVVQADPSAGALVPLDLSKLADDVSLTQIHAQAEPVVVEPREAQPEGEVGAVEPSDAQPVVTQELTPAREAKAARTVDRDKAAALSRKALTQYLHGDLDAAYATYRRASQANPEEAAAFRGMGLAASRLGKTREARRAYMRYLELSPKALDADLIRARLAELK